MQEPKKMQPVDLTRFGEDGFILHFSGSSQNVSALTFGKTLVSFSEAVEYFGDQVHQGHKVEVTLDSTEYGSFRARMRLTEGADAAYLFDIPTETILSSITGCMFKKTASSDSPLVVDERGGKVALVRKVAEGLDYEGNLQKDYEEEIVISREAYDLVERVKNDPISHEKIADIVTAVNTDASITTFGICHNTSRYSPVLSLSRRDVSTIIENRYPSEKSEDSQEKEKKIVEHKGAILKVYKAIFDRTTKKWEFVWNKKRISTTITDDIFFDKLENRTISISQGDIFEVDLNVHQEKGADNSWRIKEYEVTKIIRHLGTDGEQLSMNLGDS